MTDNKINTTSDSSKKAKYKIGIVGDKSSVIGFRAVGFVVHEVSNYIEAEIVINKIARENYAVIFLIEDLAKDMQETLQKYKSHPIPAIIPIAGKSGSTGYGIAQIKKSVERAVGADILFKDK